jgi:plastocyanin
MEGFLGTGASWSADLNLVLHIVMALALLGGMVLARRKRFTAHGIVQSSVMLLNLVLIARIMGPSFIRQVAPQIPAGLSDSYYWVAFAHATAGSLAELLGLYVVLVAGTRLVPAALRFDNYKRWMRTTLVLWWAVTFLGIGTYAKWYMGPSASKVTTPAPAKAPDRVTVTIQNFSFMPKDVVIPEGATVEWTDVGGRHSVQADDGSFQSDTLIADGKFEHKFDKPGTYAYFCSFHGSMGGKDMAGTVTVQPKK